MSKKKYNQIMDEVHVTKDMEERILKNIEDASPEIEKARAEKENKVVPIKKQHKVRRQIFVLAASFIFIIAGISLFSNFIPSGNNDHGQGIIPVASSTQDETKVSSGKDKPAEKPEKTSKADKTSKTEKTTKKSSKKPAGSKTSQTGGRKKVSSKKKLSKEVGYEVAAVSEEALPIDVSNEEYVADGDVANVQYSGSDGTVEYKQAPVSNAKAATFDFDAEAVSETTSSASTVPEAPEPKPDESTTAEGSTTEQPPAADIHGRTVVYVDGMQVTLIGSNGKYTQARWTKDGYAYALRSSKPLTYEEMVIMIRSVD